jgi:protein-S-isoprenylcysteine O-methyltransferase Ste14
VVEAGVLLMSRTGAILVGLTIAVLGLLLVMFSVPLVDMERRLVYKHDTGTRYWTYRRWSVVFGGVFLVVAGIAVAVWGS